MKVYRLRYRAALCRRISSGPGHTSVIHGRSIEVEFVVQDSSFVMVPYGKFDEVIGRWVHEGLDGSILVCDLDKHLVNIAEYEYRERKMKKPLLLKSPPTDEFLGSYLLAGSNLRLRELNSSCGSGCVCTSVIICNGDCSVEVFGSPEKI